MRLVYPKSNGFTLVLAMITPACAASASRDPEQVICANGRSFTLERDGRQAHVRWDNAQLDLARRSSPLGERYDGQDSSIIVDGDFIAFVPHGDAGWRDCHFQSAARIGRPEQR